MILLAIPPLGMKTSPTFDVIVYVVSDAGSGAYFFASPGREGGGGGYMGHPFFFTTPENLSYTEVRQMGCNGIVPHPGMITPRTLDLVA